MQDFATSGSFLVEYQKMKTGSGEMVHIKLEIEREMDGYR